MGSGAARLLDRVLATCRRVTEGLTPAPLTAAYVTLTRRLWSFQTRVCRPKREETRSAPGVDARLVALVKLSALSPVPQSLDYAAAPEKPPSVLLGRLGRLSLSSLTKAECF